MEPDRFRGAVLGLAVGDALGTTVEFRPPGTFEPVTDMVGGGPFGLPAGAWTDDTSMALCLAESLVKRRGFDPVDQLERYTRWYRHGHWSSTGRCFDIGNATRAALERFERTREPYPGDAAPDAAGNGPLMRLAPVVLAYAGDPLRAVRYAGLSARTTHGAHEAVDACRYFAGLLLGALAGASVTDLLRRGVFEPVPGLWARAPLHPKVAAVAEGSFLRKHPPEIRGAGYVVDALEAALWALSSTSTFEEGVLAAVNLGDDADTTAAIFGQLAGAISGVDGIPAAWRERVAMRDELAEAAGALVRMAERTAATDGPVAGSRWVQPGRLLTGPAPGSPVELEALARSGISALVDLSDDGAAARAPGITHVRIPVPEDAPRGDWRVVAALNALHMSLGGGEVVYLHDDGAARRTGLVLACMLIGNGAPATEVLALLSRLGVQGITSPQHVHERLRAGGPVVVERSGLVVQALSERDDRMVRVEVLDPVYWQTGDALSPDEHQMLEDLGLHREEGMWALTGPGGAEAVSAAAHVMLAVVGREAVTEW